MVRKTGVVFGFVFMAILIGLPLFALDSWTHNDFLVFYARNLSLTIMLTILSLNIAAIIFFLGNLLPLEAKFNKRFDGTRRELKHNVYFMTVLTAADFICVSAAGKTTFHLGTTSWQTILGYASAVLTVLIVMGMLEIIDAILAFDGTKKP